MGSSDPYCLLYAPPISSMTTAQAPTLSPLCPCCESLRPSRPPVTAPSHPLWPSAAWSQSLPFTRTHSYTVTHTGTHVHTHAVTHMCTHLQHGPTLTLHTFSCARTHTHVYLTCMYMCTSYTDTFHIHAQVPHTDHTPVHTHSSDINTDHTRVHTSAGCKHVHTNKSTHVTGTSPHKCCPHTYHTHVDTRVHGAPLSYICRT